MDPIHRTLYFAYGSNLSLPQMAQRCPGSVFVGRATLCGYRWQINERGVANAVPVADPDGSGSDKGTEVEGLLYRVTPQDEATLDRNEGTARGFYEKQTLPVKMLPHPDYAERPTEEVSRGVAQRLDGSGRLSSVDAEMPDVSGPSGADADPWWTAETPALVYTSARFTQDGRIRDEYVGRMRIAVKYALALGVSQDFVDTAIQPHLVDTASPPLGENANPHEKKADAPRTDCGVAGCAHSSERLCRLRLENRQPHKTSGIRFDAGLLALLAQRMAEAEQVEDTVADTEAAGTIRNKPIYVVLLQVPLLGTEASYSVEAVTYNLALANELAMKYFRDACSKAADWAHSSKGGDDESGTENASTGPPVIAHDQPNDARPGPFSCLLDNTTSCLRLDMTSQKGGRVHVWVSKHAVLE